jgi:threonylcarbamoyladenosine tRNA methylthiotransferase MtaB
MSMDKTFAIVTIGCKLNQFDSEELREALLRRGWRHRRPEEGARFFVINSCTVTGRSDARCRNAVRRTRRLAPDAVIAVTGCYAETQPAALEAMREVDIVVGNGMKRSLPTIMEAVAAGSDTREAAAAAASLPGSGALPIERFFDHSRAFVKVQDGCDARCSYCIVPRARGPGRSVPVSAVLRQIEILAGNGYREIVLTGIHIGRYGADLDPRETLASLVGAILERTAMPRIRLGSIEPTEVSPALLSLLGSSDRIAPHLHVPLQSGDDAILAAMGRPYRAADFRERIEAVARARSDAAIGTDLIVGFPGESEAHFSNTLSLVRDLPVDYFHVFTFSPRPLTPAASMPGGVSPDDRKSRSERLIELGEAKWRAFLRSQVGTVQTALVEGRARPGSRALTGTYCEVYIDGGSVEPGALVPVRIERLSRGRLHGAALDGRGSSGAAAGGGGR